MDKQKATNIKPFVFRALPAPARLEAHRPISAAAESVRPALDTSRDDTAQDTREYSPHGPEAPAPAPSTDSLTGTPTPAPAAEETAAQRPEDALSNEEVVEHTASLWKYHPNPDTELEPSPEYRSSETVYPGSRIIAARVRGKKHKHEGSNCDDWYETACFENITFIAVSDGAGSKKFSRIGAEASCKAAVGYLAQTFASAFADTPALRRDVRLPLSDPKCVDACKALAGIVQQSVIKAFGAVEAAYYSRAADPEFSRALNRSLELRDLSGTLLIAVIVPLETGTREQKGQKEHLVISCQVGDGIIAVLHTNGPFSSSLKLMGEPDSGDFSGETDFLTSPRMHQIEALQNKTRISRGVFDTVLVMSDGVADDYFPNKTELLRLYYDLVANGILEGKGPALSLASLNQQQIRLFKRLPEPIAYPWVNDQSVKIALHYTDRICEAEGLSLEDIWRDPTVLSLSRMYLDERMEAASADKRLLMWLDNYVQRGSFDDRTLVIAAI